MTLSAPIHRLKRRARLLARDRDIPLHAALDHVAEAAWERVVRSGERGRTVTLKFRRADFRTFTRARSLVDPVADRAQFAAIGQALMARELPVAGGIRLLGLTLSNILDASEGAQPVLPLG